MKVKVGSSQIRCGSVQTYLQYSLDRLLSQLLIKATINRLLIDNYMTITLAINHVSINVRLLVHPP